jgi:hypothetical protein
MNLYHLLLLGMLASGPADSFELHTRDCAIHVGTLTGIQKDWSVTLGGTKLVQVPGAEFVSLRRAGVPLPAHPLGEQVVLANGNRVRGTILTLRDERVRFRPDHGKETALSLSNLSILWFTPPEREDDPEMLVRRLASARRTRDVVLLRNGDRIEGTLNEIDAKTIRVETQGKESPIDRANVAAVALNSDLIQAPRPKGVYGHLVLRDGSRLGLASVESDGRTLTGKMLFGTVVAVPLQEVVALDIRQGPAVYLSDLKPKKYEHTPYLGIRWPSVNDASVQGRPLRLASGTHDKGIGLHSESRLTYDLAGSYRWFQARVGLDEQTGREGSVRVRVLVDGKPADLGEDRELTGRDPPRAVRVAVAGARELTLVVEFGRGGDLGDHVNWVDARLLK